MEALLAVGLAGNVVQFLQFASKIAAKANVIRKKGQPSSIPQWKQSTQQLARQAEVITDRLRASTTVLSQEDQCLIDVAIEFGTLSQQFVAYLDNFIQDSGSRTLFQSAKQSIKFQWHHPRVVEYFSQLDQLRSALKLATMLALRTHSNGNLEDVTTHLKQLYLDRQDTAREQRNILPAIERVIILVEGQTDQRLDEMQQQVGDCLRTLQSTRNPLSRTREDEILHWLYFRQIKWRFDEVDKAYRQTYEWVFDEEVDEKNSFVAHLTESNVSKPYFINGKAGSGKSTLLKFIAEHTNTDRSLRQWAQPHNLLALNFFFWNLGTPLQKTHTGLLRALVHDILSQHPELIPIVFPKLYWSQMKFDVGGEPTYIEMKNAFHILREKTTSFLRLCIFVDGIDELDGDQKDVSEFLCSLASPQIKLVVSSRPITPCLLAFRNCPGLQLQDLTKGDMDTVARGLLYTHPLMSELVKRFQQKTEKLVSGISSKAEGVFLWTRFVIHILIDGLEAGDDMDELQHKLNILPSGLRELYRRMLNKMSKGHQVQAAEMFQIYHKWFDATSENLPSLIFSYAHKDPSHTFKLDVGAVSGDDIHWQLKSFYTRLRSRCCGLLEISDRGAKRVHDQDYLLVTSAEELKRIVEHSSVDCIVYSHRTVAEFITSPDVWADISTATGPTFDPSVNLAAACLSGLKTMNHIKDSEVVKWLPNFMLFSRTATKLSNQLLGELMSNLDEAMGKMHQEHTLQPLLLHWSTNYLGYIPPSQEIFNPASSIYSFSAFYGVAQYLDSCSPPTDELSRYVAVMLALKCWYMANVGVDKKGFNIKKLPTTQERIRTLKVLFRTAADPEQRAFGMSLWSHAVGIASLGYSSENLELLEIFLANAKSAQDLRKEHLPRILGVQSTPEAMLEEYVRIGDPEVSCKASQLLEL
ncbi:hypothetical protein P154DRAFT_563928 [Amniculicola lignicola CBS 123094]|uniref:NACHT domain-containing protein n=1 Tax=Amniculicola lignicola CBS 123094 TaxID=1392246 RepID=A0A6A5WEW1_9PLEO|nr:hypothetical protein P154DRAFT_563928 [Amniculicola lignicola CBS 123094]